jgi:hypothetical protein
MSKLKTVRVCKFGNGHVKECEVKTLYKPNLIILKSENNGQFAYFLIPSYTQRGTVKEKLEFSLHSL